MKTAWKRALIGAGVLGLAAAQAHAQVPYYYGNPIGGIVGAVLAPFQAQQQQEAAQRARDAYYHQQQVLQYERNQQEAQAQEQARERQTQAAQERADEARQQAQEQAAENRREAAQEAAERRREHEAEVKEVAAEKAAAAKEKAEEDSPNNTCATHENAAMLLSAMSNFKNFQDNGLVAVDIKHLRTVPSLTGLTCHGTFVLNNGMELPGTMRETTNVAGQSITTWQAD